MICDPFTDCYAARNLDLGFWENFQKIGRALSIVEQIKAITDRDLSAEIPMQELNYLGLYVAVECEMKEYLHRKAYDHAWWTGVCLCLLTNSWMEDFPNRKKMKFTKSEGTVPLIAENVIHTVDQFNKIQLTPRIPIDKKVQQELF